MRPTTPLDTSVAAPDWSTIRAVVFDVDGTLYDGARLRRVMAWRILCWLAVRPWRFRDMAALQSFRRTRERLAEQEANEINRRQYEIAAAETRISASQLKDIVEEWIHRRPLAELAKCRRPGIRELFHELRRNEQTIAVWSDYPVDAKLAALGLQADLTVSAEDPDVQRMKPQPAGLEQILGRLAIAPEECLLIGDRDDRDGEAARRAGVPYLLIQDGGERSRHTFSDYSWVLATLRQR